MLRKRKRNPNDRKLDTKTGAHIHCHHDSVGSAVDLFTDERLGDMEMIDIKAIREQAENGYPVEDCVIDLCDEIERLTTCLKKANDQAEHLEREWYLRGDEVEMLQHNVFHLENVIKAMEAKQ